MRTSKYNHVFPGIVSVRDEYGQPVKHDLVVRFPRHLHHWAKKAGLRFWVSPRRSRYAREWKHVFRWEHLDTGLVVEFRIGFLGIKDKHPVLAGDLQLYRPATRYDEYDVKNFAGRVIIHDRICEKSFLEAMEQLVSGKFEHLKN